GPIVRHLDPGQRGVAVEDDAEEVPDFSLVPVIGRVGVDDGGDVRVRIGCGDLQVHHPDVGDGEQRVDGVQFPAGVVGIVHTADADAELEPQIRVVTHAGGHQWQVLAGHVDPQLLVMDHDLLHRGLEVHAGLGQHLGQHVHDLVEVAAVGPGTGPGHGLHAFEAAVSGGVPGAVHPEHAAAHRHHVQRGAAGGLYLR